MSTNVSTSNKMSYADKLKKKILPLTDFAHPSEEQGIVFNGILDYKLRDYLVAIKDLVHGPTNIIAASKVSRNRVILHLKTKDLVDEFFENHGGFQIESNYIKCRKLTVPTQKIILSHVNPQIPNSIIEDYIQNILHLNLTSDISFLRVNPHDQLFGHIVSWRRQFYTNTEINQEKFPGSFLIDFDNKPYRIFVTFDEFTCFKCHSKGHRAEECPMEEDENTVEQTQGNPIPMEEDENTVELTQGNPTPIPTDGAHTTPQQINTIIDITPPIENDTVKRPRSDNSSQTFKSDSEAIHAPKTKKIKPDKNNILPIDQPTSGTDSKFDGPTPDSPAEEESAAEDENTTLKEIFAPLKENMDKFADRYVLSLENLQCYIDMVKDNKQAVSVAKDFKVDLKGLLITLKENYQFLEHRKTKIKFTKISKLLQKELEKSTQSA